MSEQDKEVSLTDRTTIQLWAVVMAMPFAAALIIWAAAVQHEAVSANSRNDEQDVLIKDNRMLIEKNAERQTQKLEEINGRTIRIEEFLKHWGK